MQNSARDLPQKGEHRRIRAEPLKRLEKSQHPAYGKMGEGDVWQKI